MTGTTLPTKYKPGSVLAREIQGIPVQERSAFVDSLERKGKATADLELLREIRAYRALAAQAPLPKPKG